MPFWPDRPEVKFRAINAAVPDAMSIAHQGAQWIPFL